MVQNIYGVSPPHTEDHHKAIDHINTMLQVIQTQIYELEVLAQANAVLTSSNAAIMAQLAHMTVTVNYMQAQLKTPTASPTRSKRKYYRCSCEINYTHSSKP